jgi:hypothetical protein
MTVCVDDEISDLIREGARLDVTQIDHLSGVISWIGVPHRKVKVLKSDNVKFDRQAGVDNFLNGRSARYQ